MNYKKTYESKEEILQTIIKEMGVNGTYEEALKLYEAFEKRNYITENKEESTFTYSVPAHQFQTIWAIIQDLRQSYDIQIFGYQTNSGIDENLQMTDFKYNWEIKRVHLNRLRVLAFKRQVMALLTMFNRENKLRGEDIIKTDLSGIFNMVNQELYTWDNCSGDVGVFDTFNQLRNEENWNYLDDYRDSLDYFEMGTLHKINKEEARILSEKYRIIVKTEEEFFDLPMGEYETPDHIKEETITGWFFGIPLIKTNSSVAFEEVAKLLDN